MRAICLGLVFGGAVFAAINSCPNSISNSSVSNGVTSATVPIPGAGPGNDFATLGAAGCTAVDISFSNFGGTFSGTGIGNNILTAGGTYFSQTPSGTFDPIATQTLVTIASVRGTATVSTDADNNDGTNNWISQSSSGGHSVDDSLAFVVTSSSNQISGITLTINNPVFQSGANTGSITFNFCQGGTGTGVISTSAACTAAGGTLVSSGAINLVTGSSQTFTFNFTQPLNRFDLTTVISLAGQGNKTAGFDSIGIGFTEIAPEPSTFALFGGALMGLGLLRFRRKRA